MPSTTAHVPTANASRFLQQLCKHWSHKLDVTYDSDNGTVRFPDAVATMAATPDALLVTIRADDEGEMTRIQEVVARHLDRFAFREAPLPFAWIPAEAPQA